MTGVLSRDAMQGRIREGGGKELTQLATKLVQGAHGIFSLLTHFCALNVPNAFAVRALPRIPLEELTAFPRRTSWW